MNIAAVLRRLYYWRLFSKLKSYGNNVILSIGGFVKNPQELQLGSNVFISRNFHISAYKMVIGDNVMIGPNLLAECNDHIYDQVGKTMWETRNEKNHEGIVIENDVWMGGNVVLTKGINVGEGCIVGAGSVVTKNIPPYSIAVGVPCKPLKSRFTSEVLERHLKKVESTYSFQEILAIWNKHGL
jgi:acetyltransferase-like isoleucine patch superfamily enzyme